MEQGIHRFHFYLFFFLLFLLFSAAADTLTQGGALTDGQTLISQNLVFELGFFSLSGANSSKARYLGIWCHGLPSMAVVWVANRNQPLFGAGSLAFSGDGNLVIFSAAGNSSIQITNFTSATGDSSLYLSNAGNLILNASSGNQILWQSFDHPTDTSLPGMKLTVDLTARKSKLLRSWKNANDPGEGNFSLGLDPRGSAQVFIWEGQKPRWRSGQWNGRFFLGVSIRPLGLNGFHLAKDLGQMELSFSEYNGSIFRFVIQPQGILYVEQMVPGGNKWTTAFALPGNDCEKYNWCGNNAQCFVSVGGRPTCQCLHGFVPAAEGCTRRTELRCGANGGDRDGFVAVRGITLPDFSRWDSTGNCEQACLGNCSCAAYAQVSQIGCLLWEAPLVDLHQPSSGGYDLYLKLAASDLPAGARDWTWAVILGISLLAAAAFALFLYLCRCRRTWIQGWWNKIVKRETNEERSEPETASSTLLVEDNSDTKGTELSLLAFDTISKATASFSDSNKLGEGGFGHVYKAWLPDGREAAVKRLSEKSGQGIEEFKNEVKLIAKLQHRNLVRLIGCCVEGEEKILVYEYLPNKSLDAFIFNQDMGVQLDWRKRFDIIEGIARGLLYLHRDSRLRIIHRDLKASNILLDEEMNPKISDFGMARIFGSDQNQANTNRVVGTFGYMSPEYAMEGLFSIKSDVYSFGVLMLEIISGQRNNILRVDNSPNLIGRAWQLWNEDKSTELVDPSIKDTISTREVTRCVQVGLLCVQDRAHERPTMTSVVSMLGTDAIIVPVPRPPTFTTDGETSSFPHEYSGSISSRDITVSVVTGRQSSR